MPEPTLQFPPGHPPPVYPKPPAEPAEQPPLPKIPEPHEEQPLEPHEAQPPEKAVVYPASIIAGPTTTGAAKVGAEPAPQPTHWPLATLKIDIVAATTNVKTIRWEHNILNSDILWKVARTRVAGNE